MNAKRSLCLIKQRAITETPDRDGELDSRSSHFTPEERAPLPI